jgi:hypothetical protein
MKNVVCITLLAGSAVANYAAAESKIAVHHLEYKEYDDRVQVGDSVISIEQTFGVDYTLTANFGVDTVSGASPALQPQANASSSAQFNNAQGMTDEVLLSYDPNGEYLVKKVPLTDKRRSSDVALTIRDEDRNEYTVGGSYSSEGDYVSRGVFGQYLTYADERKNRSYIAGFSWLHDTSDVFTTGYRSKVQQDLDTFNVELGSSQILSPEAYIDLTLFGSHSRGYLSNHYLTVLREIDVNNNGTIGTDEVFAAADNRPETRNSVGVNVRHVQQFKGDHVLQSSYRFYTDSWDIRSHTLSAQLSLKLTDKLTFMPIYTYYTQTAASFFKDPETENNHFATTGYASSDLRLGDFDADTFELGASYQFTKNLSVDGSIAQYKQSNNFKSNWAVAGFTVKF